MGDRGNIIIKDADSTVYLYTHWTGSDLPNVLRNSLKRAKTANDNRWDDGPYLARIIFWDMIKDQHPEETRGFGISSVEGDGGTNITVDVGRQTVDGIPFQTYVESAS
jgi:hypothetical protein